MDSDQKQKSARKIRLSRGRKAIVYSTGPIEVRLVRDKGRVALAFIGADSVETVAILTDDHGKGLTPAPCKA
jgi:hypothetical protein